MRQLDHVAKMVLSDIKKKAQPKNYSEAMTEWYNYKTTGGAAEEAEIAFSIQASKKQSEILEALILSNCPPEIILESLSIPVKSVQIYKELFFDISCFKTKLDKIEYLEEYKDEWGKDLKIKAVSLGYEFVLFNYANLVPKTDSQKKLIERMFMATAYKAMAMNYNGIKSDVNKQAVKHAELMMKAYDLLVKTNAEDTSSSFDLVNLLTVEPKAAPDKVKAEEIV